MPAAVGLHKAIAHLTIEDNDDDEDNEDEDSGKLPRLRVPIGLDDDQEYVDEDLQELTPGEVAEVESQASLRRYLVACVIT